LINNIKIKNCLKKINNYFDEFKNITIYYFEIKYIKAD
jgi:hypothetical protein